MQAKTYARSSESQKQDNDRSIISINNTATSDHQWYCAYHQCESHYTKRYYHKILSADIALKLVLGIVLLTNILLFILSLGYFHHAFNWLFKKEWIKKSFYRSSVIVLLCLNCSTVVYDLVMPPLLINFNLNSVKIRAALVFKLLAMVLMPMLEFPWIVFKMYCCYNPQLGKCKIFLHSIGLFGLHID